MARNTKPATRIQFIVITALPATLVTLTCLLFNCGALADGYPNIDSRFWDEDADWYQQCMRAKDHDPPAADLPPPETIQDLAECEPTDLYYAVLDNPGNPGSGETRPPLSPGEIARSDLNPALSQSTTRRRQRPRMSAALSPAGPDDHDVPVFRALAL